MAIAFPYCYCPTRSSRVPPPFRACASSSSASASSKNKQQQQNLPAGWTKFAAAVSGEWSGCCVDFDKHGKPLPLPASLIPEAYQEWGVDLYDWETYCATLAEQQNSSSSFYNKTLRLYPTSGCAATTVTVYRTEEQSLNEDSNDGFLGFHSTGAYVAVWRRNHLGKVPVLEVEHCLIDENKEGERVRMLQKLDAATLNLLEITVFKEHWEEPFRSGESVESCLTSHGAFAGNGATHPATLQGTWTVVKSCCNCSGEEQAPPLVFKRLCVQRPSTKLERSTVDGFTLLPDGLWSHISKLDDGKVLVEGGWHIAFDRGTAAVSRCKLSKSGEVETMDLETQYRETAVQKTYHTVHL